MKNALSLLLLLVATAALADGPVIQTTPFTRNVLRAPDAGTVRSDIGVSTTAANATNQGLWTPTLHGGTTIVVTNTNPWTTGGTATGSTNVNPWTTGGTATGSTNVNPWTTGGTATGSTNVNPWTTGGTSTGSTNVNPWTTGGTNQNVTFNGINTNAGTMHGGNYEGANYSGLGSSLSNLTVLQLAELQNSVQNIAQDQLPNFINKLASHYPLKIMWLGDSVSRDTSYGILATLEAYMPTNGAQFQAVFQPGTLSGGSWFEYPVTTATVVAWAAGQPATGWPLPYFVMANGQAFQSGSTIAPNFTANTVEMYYWASNNFGSLAVQTNAGAGWATMATVNANNGGARTGVFTNFFFPEQLAPNGVNVKVVSTGNNEVMGVGIYDTNQNQGVVQNWFGNGGIDLNDLLGGASTNSTVDGFVNSSNDFVAFFQGMKPDLVLIEAKDPAVTLNGNTWAADHIKTTLTNLVSAMRNSTWTNVDIVFVNPADDNPRVSYFYWTQRIYVDSVAPTLGIGVFDMYNMIPYYSTAVQNTFYQVGGVHLLNSVLPYVGAGACRFLDIPQRLVTYGYVPFLINPVTSLPRANLTGYDPVRLTGVFDGAICWFTFSEGKGTAITDYTLNGNNGTLSSANVWTNSGHYGNALALTGSDFVQVANDFNPMTNFSVSIWFDENRTANGNNTTEMLADNDNSGGAFTQQGTWGIGKANFGPGYGLNFATKTSAGTFASADYTPGTWPATNVWHNVICTYDGVSNRIYFDGALVAMAAQTGYLPVTGNQIGVGAWPAGSGDFIGMVDDFVIWPKKVLSTNEVQAVFLGNGR